ncbi:MAG: nitrous oxide-stimulated promoter family protein [Desulfuromonadales bacterium]
MEKMTSTTPAPLTRKESKDLRVLAWFTAVFCRARHSGEKLPLPANADLATIGLERYRCCTECREFLAYAIARRRKCPLDPKPTCKHCHVHCYRPGHREKVKEIMRFSGRRLLLRGRLDLLWHYLF